MAAEVNYNEEYKRIRIQQSTAQFDEVSLAPAPFVAYEKKLKNGVIWNHAIPLIQGSGCWMNFIDSIPPAELIKQTEYPPVSVLQNSSIVIQYPKGMESSSIKV